jgi:hypothetical protein
MVRVVALMGGLFLARDAAAWTADEAVQTVLPGSVTAMVPVSLAGGTAIVAVGPEGAWLIDPARGVLSSRPVPGVSVIERTNGDEVAVWVCGATGVRRMTVGAAGLGEPELVLGDPCRAIAEQPEAVVVASTTVRRFPIERDRLGVPVELGAVGLGPILLAADAERVVFGTVGALEVTEVSSWGRSTIATGGPVSAIAVGAAGLVWARSDTAMLGSPDHHQTALAPGPMGVAPVTLGAGESGWLVLHDGRIGLVVGGDERLFAGPTKADVGVASDLDLDGCVDLVVAGGPVVVATYGSCGGPAPVAAPTTTGFVTNGPTMGTRSAGQTIPQSQVGGGAGLPPPPQPTVRPGFETAGIAVPILLGSTPVVSTHAGEAMRLRLVHPRNKSGITFLSRGGPPGLIVYRDGLVEYLPTSTDVGRWSLTVTMLDGFLSRTERLGIVVLPARQDGAAPMAAVVAPVEPARAVPDTDRAVCAIGLGVAGGGSYEGSSWDRIGQPALAVAASPAASLACDLSDRPVRWFVGMDTAPLFKYGVGSATFVHFAAASAGVMFGSPKFRAGPYGTVGLLLLGGGFRAVWTPIGGAEAPYRGLELRLTGYFPSSPAGQVMILFTSEVG